MTPVISTYSGLSVNPLAVKPEQVNITDISHALACCNRFAGHLSSPVSVAQHSVYVARIVRNMGANANIQMQALLHDATEAYLGDVTKWLKESDEFKAYRDAELRLQYTIMAKYGCPLELDEMVKEADSIICDYEANQGRLNIGQRQTTLYEQKVIGKGWYFWDWRDAESCFLAHHQSLSILMGR